MSHESITAVAALLHALAWPIALILIVLLYRKPITKLLESLRSVKWGNFGAELGQLEEALNREAKELLGAAPEEAAKEVTPEQVEAAARVGRIYVRRSRTDVVL